MEKLLTSSRRNFYKYEKSRRHIAHISRFAHIHIFEKFSYLIYSTFHPHVLVEQHSGTKEILKYFWNSCSYKKFHIDIVTCAFVFWFPDRTQEEISVSVNGIHVWVDSLSLSPFLHEIRKAKTRIFVPPSSIIVIKHVLHILQFVARAINA